MSAKEPEVFAKLNGYNISRNCNNPLVNRINTLQQNVARMLFPVKNLMIHSFNTCLRISCSVPDTEKVLGTQQWAGDPKTLPPMNGHAERGDTERLDMNNKHKATVLVQSVLPNTTCVFLKINRLYKNRTLKTKGLMEGKDRNLLKTVAQFYACCMVKKFINATINTALDEEKTLQKWASEGLQLVSRCGAGWLPEIREKVVTPPADIACLIKQDINKAEGRCVRCEHVCIMCIPMELGTAGCGFLCSPTAFAKKNHTWANVKAMLCLKCSLIGQSH